MAPPDVEWDDCYDCLIQELIALDKGVQVQIGGQTYLLTAHVGLISADMPQVNN